MCVWKAQANLQADVFAEFRCNCEVFRFGLNLTTLLECLQLLGPANLTMTSATMSFLVSRNPLNWRCVFFFEEFRTSRRKKTRCFRWLWKTQASSPPAISRLYTTKILMRCVGNNDSRQWATELLYDEKWQCYSCLDLRMRFGNQPKYAEPLCARMC